MALPNISKDDILEALGLDSRSSWIGPAAAAFGAGLLVGAAAALILAPKSGAELRDDLANRMSRVKDRVRQEMEQQQSQPPLGRPTI